MYFQSRFPEDLYLVNPEYTDKYYRRVLAGFDIMSSSNVVIGMLTRNNLDTLKLNVARAKFLTSLFKTGKVVIYENDSTDGTKEYLDSIKKERDVSVYSFMLNLEENKQDKSEGRKKRMALYRNELRRYMMWSRDADYFILMDSDILGGFSYEGIANSFSYLIQFDVIASNSIIYDALGPEGANRRLYYDSWAWRDLDHPEEHSSEEINLRCFNRGEPTIPVLSAFGGLCIYNRNAFNTKHIYTSEDCDHVTLHKKLAQDGYKIGMNPSQITLFNRTRYVVS